MTVHSYYNTRELVDGVWNVNNPDRVDGKGDQIFLIDEIMESIPEITHLCGDGSDVKICSSKELNETEQELLNTIVYDHKNNV